MIKDTTNVTEVTKAINTIDKEKFDALMQQFASETLEVRGNAFIAHLDEYLNLTYTNFYTTTETFTKDNFTGYIGFANYEFKDANDRTYVATKMFYYNNNIDKEFDLHQAVNKFSAAIATYADAENLKSSTGKTVAIKAFYPVDKNTGKAKTYLDFEVGMAA